MSSMLEAFGRLNKIIHLEIVNFPLNYGFTQDHLYLLCGARGFQVEGDIPQEEEVMRLAPLHTPVACQKIDRIHIPGQKYKVSKHGTLGSYC